MGIQYLAFSRAARITSPEYIGPYFPQNQLSPPDEKRYRKFKLIVGLLAFVLIAVVAGVGYAVYYLVSTLLSA